MKIILSEDILPNLKEEIIHVSEDEVKTLLDKYLPNIEVNEVAFIPKVNVLFVIYNNYTRSRVMFIIKENSGIMSLGNLTLDNLDNFSLDTFELKEIRHEDFGSISEGVEVLARIVIDNNKEIK